MPYWDQSKRFKAMNEKKASKKTQNSFMNAFNTMRQGNCDHVYRDGKCIKCNSLENTQENAEEVVNGKES